MERRLPLYAVTPATANNGTSAFYISTDNKPQEGNNYYRIKGVDISGKISYTNIVKVFMGMPGRILRYIRILSQMEL